MLYSPCGLQQDAPQVWSQACPDQLQQEVPMRHYGGGRLRQTWVIGTKPSQERTLIVLTHGADSKGVR